MVNVCKVHNQIKMQEEQEEEDKKEKVPLQAASVIVELHKSRPAKPSSILTL